MDLTRRSAAVNLEIMTIRFAIDVNIIAALSRARRVPLFFCSGASFGDPNGVEPGYNWFHSSRLLTRPDTKETRSGFPEHGSEYNLSTPDSNFTHLNSTLWNIKLLKCMFSLDSGVPGKLTKWHLQSVEIDCRCLGLVLTTCTH